MPRITYLKEFEGKLWARLELDLSVENMPVHIFTDKEIEELKAKERKAVWDEIKTATMSNDDDIEF